MSEKINEPRLLSATWDGKTDVVKDLLNSGVDVNSRIKETGHYANVTPLMFAVLRGNVKIIEMLLSYGADVNAKDEFGYTAIMFAQEINLTHIVSMLKQAGATA